MAVDPQPHMIVMPKAFLALRVFQMVFAVFVLGVCIYGAIGAPVSGVVLNIFTALATIITLIYIFVATYSQPIIYQYWAILALEIFCLIFWLISFALLASEVAIAAAYTCGGYYYYGKYYSTSCNSETLGIIGLFGACAGVGGIEFVLFIVSLALFSVRLSRHRSGGGHCTPDAMATAAPQAYNQNGDVGHEKVEMQPQTQTYPVNAAPPQNGYYPPQGGDARYAAAPVAQPGQQYPMQQQMPQQVPQQMAAPQGQFVQQPAYGQQQAPVQYQ